MSRKKKFAVAFVCILFIVFIIFFHIYLLPYAYVYAKYDNNNDFKYISYKPWHLEFYDSANIIPSAKLVTEKWEMKSNGITFQIQKINNRLIDDYQLEELDRLCTEYLKENVEPNICHTLITTEMLAEITNEIQANLVWDKSNITTFLNHQKSLMLYAYESSQPDMTDSEIQDKLLEKYIKIENVVVRVKDSDTEFGRGEMSMHGKNYYDNSVGEIIR